MSDTQCHFYYPMRIDDVVFIVRSQHDSYHKNKANVFAKKLKEQVTARSLKVYFQTLSDSLCSSLVSGFVGGSV